MKNITLIRHAKTQGNLERRYIGRTDEPLCREGRIVLERMIGAAAYPVGDGTVFCSPMRRCLETAALIYPNAALHPIDGLRECDFGDFEGKTYDELCDNPAYQRFLDSGGNGDIPNGESVACYKRRCLEAFTEVLRVMNAEYKENAVIICHGGTIMSILEHFHQEKRSFYDYHSENCGGYIGSFDEEKQLFVSLNQISVLP